MQMKTVWDAKVAHPEYNLKGKVLLEQQWDYTMLSYDDKKGTLPFAIYGIEHTTSGNDYIPQVGDKISVEVTSEVLLHCRFVVGTVILKFDDAMITDIDDGGNLYVTAHLTAVERPLEMI